MTDLPPGIAALEQMAQREVGRGIAPMARATAGALGTAASSLAAAAEPVVAIVTGFFIADATPPAAETDGPPGAALIAAVLRDAGARVALVTDAACAPVVRATAAAAGDLPVLVADDAAAVDALARELGELGTTHVVAVERPGPAADGEVYTMRGLPIAAHVGPLHGLIGAGSWTTVGIGDGGNELGMGSVPAAVVADAVDHGERIRCVVPCDATIVAGVSNWGAAALAAAFALLRGQRTPLDLAGRHDALLRAAVAAGAVDGTTGRCTLSVDGLDLRTHWAILQSMEEVCA